MNVTKTDCDGRHKRLAVFATVFAAITVVFLMLATFAVDKAGSASEKASDVDGRLDAYTAGSDATFRHIQESLQRIERQLEALRIDKVAMP